jgi:hypothetical protein
MNDPEIEASRRKLIAKARELCEAAFLLAKKLRQLEALQKAAKRDRLW